MSIRFLSQLTAGICTCGILIGCGSDNSASNSVPTVDQPQPNTQTSTVDKSASDPANSSNTPTQSTPTTDPHAEIDNRIAAIKQEIDGGNWEAADDLLTALRQDSASKPDDAQQDQLTSLGKAIAEHREEKRREEREKLLATAKKAFDSGEWDLSLKKIDAVAALAPTESEREELGKLRASIDTAMKAQLRLGSWIKMLGSSNSGEVKTAQNQLLDEPEAALPLVRQAIRQNDAVTTKNSLEFLRKLRKPDVALPIMVSVLEDPAQKESWDVASKELLRLEHPGAGPQILNLFLNSKIPEQRQAALAALSEIVDPPVETPIRLLPHLFQDNAELPAVLKACTHSVIVHHQHDLVEWRGLGEQLTNEQLQPLNDLPARLQALQSLAADQQETVEAARQLAMSLKLATSVPLEGVTILEATPTEATIKPEALLDGVWNTTDLMTMWWTPVNQTAYLILDLGDVKTVTGLRIWNFNEGGAGYRGWKNVEVYVSDTPTALRPISLGSLLPAPGIAEPLDYSQVIPVPFARGRYVKLVCKEYISQSTYAGLTEIQVLGY